ncbi:alanine aminotransferase, aminotransferase class I, partial [Thalassiosira pseudonana CCMP1335]
KRLSIDTISDNLKAMEYAVRGKIAIEADRITEELKSSTDNKYPFDHIIMTNIGNPHAVQQKALTWPRQVMALLQLPDPLGIDHPSANALFPEDAIARAKEMKAALGGHGIGAYTHSKGVKEFREDVARFIEKRDGAEEGSVDVENIFLTAGASEAITMVMTALVKDSSCGIMLPIPQYPLYSATLDLLGGHKVGYYLDEQSIWGMKIEELERSLAEAKSQGINVVAFVLINPGNPSGAVLSRQEVKDIVMFCARHNLVLLSDEVYQENVYRKEDEFFSSRRAADELGLIKNDAIQLCSFHSVSKGVFGECGQRGGYVEMVGIEQDVNDCFYKLAASKLCSNAPGQAMVSLMCKGPNRGDSSYESHEKEKQAVFEGLRDRAQLVSEGLDSIPGFSCQPATGAMYCFPSVHMPPGAIKAAQDAGLPPDTLYSLDLLQTKGICVVPASGFGQKEGRYGFRTTFLSPEMKTVVESIRDHYEQFCSKYAE